MFEATEVLVANPDETLVKLARGGDGAAREELFRRQFDVAYRVARRLLGNEQDALDAVQDAYLKAVSGFERFSGRSGFSTWLLRIVQNAALDIGRVRSRRAGAGAIGRQSEEPACDDNQADGLEREDQRRVLDRAIAQLSPTLRITFVLFAEADKTYDEIAEIQQIPVGTVMSRIHSARQKLQATLSSERDLT